MNLTPFIIRAAEPEDAHAILECHRDAIMEKAARFYNPEILQEWMEITPKKIDDVEIETTTPGWIYLVAEDSDEKIIGFGVVISDNNEFRALYVRRNSCGCVGTKLLERLIARARQAGCPYLEGDGSINAEAFYLAKHFRILKRGMHRLNSGREMPSVKMRLEL